MPRLKLTKRSIDGPPAGARRFTVWDSDVTGFGVRVTPNGERIYVLKYRLAHQQRWFTIGPHGSPWTPDSARREAVPLLGEVARGIDPADKRRADRRAISFAGLCDLDLAEGVAHKKAGTIRSDRGRIELHLKPALAERADAINRADVERLLNDVKNGRTSAAAPEKRGPGSIATGGAGVAAQCVALASTVLQFAVDRGVRLDNPARGVKKPPVRKMQRFLSEGELRKLAASLDHEAESSGNAHAIAAIRLLALTGCRRGEVVNLRWRLVEILAERRLLVLDGSKTREKVVYLSPPATDSFTLPRIAGTEFVIAGTKAGKPSAAIDKTWDRVRRRAGLEDVRIHDLRHTFASVGASASYGLPIIGKLLGHTQAATTQRYAHLAADPVRHAADAIGPAISAAMEEGRRANELGPEK